MASDQRAVRIGNCSGAMIDPGDNMLVQATAGQIDVITGDYLAEANIADYAEAFAAGRHPGYALPALDGLQKSLSTINKKRIKVIINGGVLNPKGLAEVVQQLADKQDYYLKVAYVEGDNLLSQARELLQPDSRGRMPHLDADNVQVRVDKDTANFLKDLEKPIVSANAYLGCRAIRRGLDEGADIIICGRVADASPVMGAAAWWHGWADDDFDQLAGSLVAGHLIECSNYSTGGNFAGFDQFQTKDLLNLACPLAEIAANGESIITKHQTLNGFVTEDVIKCQLLYELQGNIYLNSDVKADLHSVKVEQVGKNRVHVYGTRGFPPPPTTKLAVFYKAGFQGELTINATGYATQKKWDLQETQLRTKLEEWGLMSQIDLVEFQRVGVPQENPKSQLAATSYLRIFVQAAKADTIRMVLKAWAFNFMQHFPGMHCTLDWRLMNPLAFLGYYPALVAQTKIDEAVVLLKHSGTTNKRISVGAPKQTEPLSRRDNYDPVDAQELSSFGPTTMAPLGDIVLARSGDKGANVNIGFTVHTADEWAWLRSFLTRQRMQKLMGEDWQDWYHVERVEFPGIKAVHFVVYGALGRGVSSSARLDNLGKGFAEFIRYIHVPIPNRFLSRSGGGKRSSVL